MASDVVGLARAGGRAPWLLCLASCLVARVAEAVERTDASHRDVLQAEYRYRPGVRWRDDDPDLVRAGAFARWEDALAEGARIRGEQVVDLDGDGADERLLTVAPRRDPSPQNGEAGFVLLSRSTGARGVWRATVLFRPAPTPDLYAYEYAPSATLTLRREGRRVRLVLAIELLSIEERREGGGHEEYPHGLMARFSWRDGVTRVDGICHRQYDSPWRGARLHCACPAGDPRCAACAGPVAVMEPDDVSLSDASLPAWCRAELRSRAHELVLPPPLVDENAGRP